MKQLGMYHLCERINKKRAKWEPRLLYSFITGTICIDPTFVPGTLIDESVTV